MQSSYYVRVLMKFNFFCLPLMRMAYSIFETGFYQQRIPRPRNSALILQFANDIKIFKI